MTAIVDQTSPVQPTHTQLQKENKAEKKNTYHNDETNTVLKEDSREALELVWLLPVTH